MRLEQGKLCLCIRKAEQSFKQLFSQKRAFSEYMEKWQDDDLMICMITTSLCHY